MSKMITKAQPGIFHVTVGGKKYRLEYAGKKEGGIHEGDPAGGMHKYTDAKGQVKKCLVKRAPREESHYDIAEYLASKIYAVTAEGTGAKLDLAPNEDNHSDNPNPFLVSHFFENFKDFYKAEGYDKRPTNLEAAQALLRLPQYVKEALSRKDAQGNYVYKNYPKSVITRVLLRDLSSHSGNFGTVDDEILVAYDFGAAFRDFPPDIDPFKSETNRIGLEKNYLLRDHPRERIISKEFSDELRRVADIDLSETIKREWAVIAESFDEDARKKFGAQIGVPVVDLKTAGALDKGGLLEQFLIKRMKQRQQSLRNFATEIDIALAIGDKDLQKQHEMHLAIQKIQKRKEELERKLEIVTNQKKRKKIIADLQIVTQTLASKNAPKDREAQKSIQTVKVAIKKAELENPGYLQRILNDPTKAQLGKLPKGKTKIFKALLNEIQEEQLAASIVPQTYSRAKTMSQDVSITPNVSSYNGLTPNTSQVSKQSSYDPVTAALYEHVVTKQLQILQNIANENDSSLGALTLEQFQDYIENPANKEVAAQLYSNLDAGAQIELHKAELSGYNLVHEQFKDCSQAINWGNQTTKNQNIQDEVEGLNKETNTQIVRDGKTEVCKLTQTTIKTPVSIKVNNDWVKISNYRKITLPLTLSSNTGPVTFSFPLKDANGQNMHKNAALYFTVSYDEQGKLIMISGPKPQFLSEDPNALGYIVRNGAVYTLPVTRGMYEKLQIELKRNKDINITQPIAQKLVVEAQGIGHHLHTRMRKHKGQLHTHDHPPHSHSTHTVNSH